MVFDQVLETNGGCLPIFDVTLQWLRMRKISELCDLT